MIRTPLRLFALALAAAPTFAQDINTWEKVLLPIVASTEVVGVNGARFATAISAIAGNRTVRYFPAYSFDGGGRVSPAKLGTLVPDSVTGLYYSASYSRNGRLLYLEPSTEDTATLAAYLLSSRGGAEVYNETALPVVRSGDFITGTANILGIRSAYTYAERPNSTCRDASPQFRHALRVYDVDARGDAVVRVRIYTEDGPSSSLRQEVTLTLSGREGNDPTYPTFVEIAIDEFCRPFSCRTPCAGGSERVEITPVSPGLRYSAMVSATDNLTQQVSLAYPQ